MKEPQQQSLNQEVDRLIVSVGSVLVDLVEKLDPSISLVDARTVHVENFQQMVDERLEQWCSLQSELMSATKLKYRFTSCIGSPNGSNFTVRFTRPAALRDDVPFVLTFSMEFERGKTRASALESIHQQIKEAQTRLPKTL